MPLTPLDLFIRATDALVKFDANFSSQRDDELDVYILELQGAEVRTLWEKVKTVFDKCLNYFAEEDSSGEDITAADTKYDVAFRCYLKVLASINRKLDELRAPPNARNTIGANDEFRPTRRQNEPRKFVVWNTIPTKL